MSSHMIRGKRVILAGTADPQRKALFLKWLEGDMYGQGVPPLYMLSDAAAVYFEPVKDSTGFIITWRESHRDVPGKNRRVKLHV